MVMIPGPLIEAPEPLRRRYGLFDAANGPLDLPRHGEGGGIRYVPHACGDGAIAYGVACYTGEEEAPDKPTSGDEAVVDTGVFVALSTLLCGPLGYSLEEYRTKVRRRLDMGEQATVEAAFWSGLDFQGNPLEILTLADGEDIGDFDDAPVVEVVAELERYAYRTQRYGGLAYIHAPSEVAAFAGEAGLVVPESNSPTARKLTPGGSVWVFGNYPSGFIAVTGQVTVWRAPEVQVRDAFNNATNERLLIAERAYAVSYDCFAGVAEFDPLEVTSP